jgi:hypothetical protein
VDRAEWTERLREWRWRWVAAVRGALGPTAPITVMVEARHVADAPPARLAWEDRILERTGAIRVERV